VLVISGSKSMVFLEEGWLEMRAEDSGGLSRAAGPRGSHPELDVLRELVEVT
jgi:hypothetical protein